MGIAAIFVTAPAAAAAAGLYLWERHHATSNSKVVGDGGVQTSGMDFLGKMKKGADRMPKLAPEFDGLYCFETVVGH